jgi:conjugative relaxase-like TrwC/TraI family protein
VGGRGLPLLGVLSIAKLRVGQEAYQLSGVAESLDAYYTGAGEAEGVWFGGGAARLGLDGQVQPDDLRAVLAGCRPGAGGLTPNGEPLRPHPRRVPGFDLTFKVPKSASVLYAVSDDPRVQGAIVEAGEIAIREAIGWLEREAIQVQRGSHNQAWLARQSDPSAGPRRLGTHGVVAAGFRHRTSRAGDPLLHWHCLIANLVEGTDGKWSAFAHPDLYRHARAAGEVFQAVFREQLTTTLGLEWRPGRHVPEIAGVPQQLIDVFSKRTDEIEHWLARTGTPDTPEGRQLAVWATRRSKSEMEHGRFDDGWKLEATAHGWGPAEAELLIASAARLVDVGAAPDETRWHESGRDSTNRMTSSLVEPDQWTAGLLDDLTAASTTFTYPDLIESLAARQGPGATTWTLERLASEVLASDDAVPVRANGTRRWTSRQMLEREQRFIGHLTTQLASANTTEAAIADVLAARPRLGTDQAEAIRLLGRSTSAVSVLIGPAGTGKTFTLDAVRAAIEASGSTVTGAAPSARAAIELEAGADIPSSTLHSLLARDRPVIPGSVLVIDEAGMADLRVLEAAVSRHVGHGGRVILVGDHRQLPEVGAGGGFAHAATHAKTVAELTVNRRQHDTWERDALGELRAGRVRTAVETYLSHDRVDVHPTPGAMIEAAVDRWFEARRAGGRPVLLAGTNELVDRLNDAVLARLRSVGELDPSESGRFSVGERIVLRRNAALATDQPGESSVANGQIGTVTGVTSSGLVVRLDTRHGDLVLSADYVSSAVSHAYALTIHRAQGGTWDQAIVVGADGLYREGAYVALSRGRAGNHLVLTDPELAAIVADPDLDRHDTGLDREPVPGVDDDLVRRFSATRAKELAHTIDPDVTFVDQLERHLPLAEIEEMVRYAASVEHDADRLVGATVHQLEQHLDRTIHTAHHAHIGIAASPDDRYNVGIITDLDDQTGTVMLRFTSADGTEAERSFRWDQVRILDPDASNRELSPTARRTLADMVAPTVEQLDRWHAILDEHGVEPGEHTRYRNAAHNIVERAAARLIASDPTWLHTLVGERPFDPAGAAVWHDTITDIARHRLVHEIPATVPGIGPRPSHDPDEWDRLNLHVGQTRIWLASTDRLEPTFPIRASRRELHERRHELEALLAAAPKDARGLVDRLSRGQLDLHETGELLAQAAAQVDQRLRWIVDNWPHVVEFQEINRTLATGTWGPDPQLLAAITGPADDPLIDAITHHDPWLRQALSELVDRDATWLTRDDVETLGAIADTRRRLGIGPDAPLDHAQITGAFELLRAEPMQQVPTPPRERTGGFGIDLD